MRKTLLSLLVSAFMCVLPMTAAVQYTLAPVGFENGALPSAWTVDQISGSATWAVEGGAGTTLTNPNGAKEGVYRAICKIPVGSAEQSVVRLITPAMNLAGVTQPQLFFSHAQSATSGLIDTLRVFYRTSANGQWKVAAEYTTAITAWKDECITLSEASGAQAYQIAFEASCSAGRKGVVLDQIFVRPASLCQNVSDINVTPMADNAVVTFTESGSAETWQVLVDTVQITDWTNYNTNSAVYFDQALYEPETTVDGLNPFTQYYLYIRSFCDDNESGFTDWVGASFRTTQRVDVLPYVVNFSADELDGTGSYKLPAGWIAGQSEDITTLIPYVAPTMSNSNLNNYSVDSTAFLAFATQSTSSPAALAAGSYAYAATPMLTTALSGCEVSFWGTAYTNIYSSSIDYAGELQVGVMSNPEDWSSFELVETVKLDHANQHKHFVVSLASYTGNGKFVALASNSAKRNFFAVDKFEVRTATNTPANVHLTEVLPTSIKVAANASTFEAKVFLGSDYVAGGVLPAVAPVATATATNGVATIALAENLQGQVLTVYAGVNGNYAFPVTFRVPTVWSHDSVPYDLTFNTGTFSTIPLKTLGNELHVGSAGAAIADLFFPLKSLSAFYPKQGTPSPAYDGGALQMEGEGAYFTLPYVDSFDGLQVSFRLSAGTSTYAGRSRVAVGVMTNPYDIATFDTLGIYDGAADGYVKCDQDFAAYQGNGHYVAILALAPHNSTRAAMSYIDNLSLQVVPTCRDAGSLVVVPGSKTATVAWDGKGMTEWIVKIATNATFTNVVADTIVNVEGVVVEGLTPNTNYYCCVQAICGTDTLARDAVSAFKTAIGVPYTDASLSTWTKWTGLMADAFAGINPTTYTGGWSSTTTAISTSHMKVNIYGGSCKYWLMSPAILVEGDASTAIRLSFDAAYTKYANANPADGDVTDDKFAVLITTDGGETWLPANATIWAGDGTGDYLITSIPNTATTINIDLTPYIGEVINVAFYGESTASGGDNDMHVANVSIAAFDANCAGVNRFTATATSSSDATINWQVQGAQSIDIAIATDAEFTNVVSNQTYTTSPVSITDLVPNTAYYVRARQTCDSEGEWTLATFRTYCAAITPEQLGIETFNDAARLECWTLGHMVDANSGNDPAIKTDNKFGKYLFLGKTAAYPTYKDGLFAVMPELDLQGDSINKYEVSFNAGTASTDPKNVARLTVGVITDPSDYSSFVETRTFNLSLATDSISLGSYSVSFADYLGDDNDGFGSYIIFYVQAGDSSLSSVVLDNVKVSRARSCRQPEDLAASQISDNSAVLTWTGYSDSYELLVLDHAINPDTLTTEAWTVVTTDSMAVENLEGLTTYYAYVRGVCGADDKSNWFGPVAFKTHCTAVTSFPWSENFDSYTPANLDLECWTNEHIAGSGSYVFRISNSTQGTNSTMKLELQDEQNGNVKKLTLPFMVIPEANAYEFSIDVYRSNYSNIKQNEGFLFTVESENGVDTIGIVPRQYTVSNDYVGAVTAVGWYTYVFPIPQAGYVNIAIYGISEYGAASYADNIEVRAMPTCTDPQKLKVSDVNTTSAVITWEGTSPLYDLYILEGVDTVGTYTGLTVDSIQVTGLLPSTAYGVSLQGVCGDDRTRVITTSFKTAYGVPFDEDFNASSSSIPADWTRRTGDLFKGAAATTSGWYFTNSNAGGLNTYHAYSSVYNSTYSGPSMYSLLTPEIELDSVAGHNLELSFLLALTSGTSVSTAPAAAALAGRTFAVAVSTDGGETFDVNNAFVWGDTTANMGLFSQLNPMAQRLTIDLNAYAGQSVVIAFYHAADSTANSSYTYINIDDVKLHSVLAGCDTPTGFGVDSVTMNSADFYWTAEEGESYELQIARTDKFSVVVVDTVVAGGSIHIDGLVAASDYYAHVAKVCGEGHSEWTLSRMFTTACAAIDQLPWTENFETKPLGSNTSAAPNCWDLVNANAGTYPYVFVNNSSSYAHDEKSLYFQSSSSKDAYAVLPEFTAPVNTLRIKFDCKFESTSSSGKLYVGGMDESLSATSFVSAYEVTRSTSWQTVTVDLGQLPATCTRVAFKYAQQTQNYYLGIDDIEVSLIPQDETLTAVETANVGRLSFDVNWAKNGDVECDEYKVVLSTVALNDSALAVAEGIIVNGATTYHFDGLDRGTRYYVYVRTNCLIDGTIYGKWVSTSVRTRTLSDAYQIGTGTGAGALVMTSWGSSFTQHIYLASELEAAGLQAGEVIGAQFEYYGTPTLTKTQTMYIGLTNQTIFAGTGNADMVPFGTLELVYGPEMRLSTEGWFTYDFETPFVWDGVSNIVVGMLTNGETSGHSSSSGWNTYGTSQDVYRSVKRYADNTVLDPASLGTVSGILDYTRPNVRFMQNLPPCPEIEEVTVSNRTHESAVINWTASTADYFGSYEVFYAAANDTINWSSVVPQFTGIDSLSVTLTGLTEYTDYVAYVRAICDGNNHNDGVSVWTPKAFRTKSECNELENVEVHTTGQVSAEVTWTATMQTPNYCYILSTVAFDLDSIVLDTVAKTGSNLTEPVIVLDNLDYGTEYFVYVANQCGTAYTPFEMVSFMTSADCPAVENLRTITVAHNAVEITWDRAAHGDESAWEVGIVGDSASIQVVNNMTAVLIGLSEQSTYTAYVKAICEDNQMSAAQTLTFTTTIAPGDETTMGTGTSTAYLVYTSWGNTVSQSIYTAAELQEAGLGAGNIVSMSFYYSGTSSNYDKVQSLYVGTTSDEEFASNAVASFVPGTDLALVYGPEFREYEAGWVTYSFSTPFYWDGVSNLVVGMQTSQPDGESHTSSSGWSTYGTSTSPLYQLIYAYKDNTPIEMTDPSAVATSATRATTRPNIRIEMASASCRMATNVKATDVTTESATLSWMPGGSETAWAVVLADSALTDGQLNTATKDTLNRVLTKTYTGLVPDVDYHFYIRSLCSANDYSDWKEFVFRTVATCVTPAGLAADSVLSNSMMLTWNALSVDYAGTYTVAYGLAAEFNLADTLTYSAITVSDTTLVLTGLSPVSTYSVVVRANCTDDDQSRWSSVLNVTTACGVISAFPYLESFENLVNDIPACWDNSEGTVSDSYRWIVYTPGMTGECVRFNSYMATNGTWNVLETPAFALPADAPAMLSFYCKNPTGGNFEVMVAAAGSTNRTTLATNLTGISSWTKVELNLSAYMGQTVRFYFKGTSNYGNGDAYVYLDDVKVSVIDASCAGVTNLTVDSVSYTTMSASWHTIGNNIVDVTVADVNGVVVKSYLEYADSTLTITDLAPGKVYVVKVQQACGEYYATVRSNTLYSLPFVENFNNGLPGSWNTYADLGPNMVPYEGEEVDYDLIDGWHIYNPLPDYGFNDYFSAGFYWISTQVYDYDMWDYVDIYNQYSSFSMVTPQVMMTVNDGEQAVLSFDMALNASSSATQAGSFAVQVSTDGTTWQTVAGWGANGDQGAVNTIPTTAATYSFDLTAFAGQAIYVAFTTSVPEAYVLIDNVEIHALNANCMGLTGFHLLESSTMKADFEWSYVGGAHDAYIELATDDAFLNVVVSDTVRNDSTYSVYNLNASTVYYARAKQICGGGDESEFVRTVSFKTPLGLRYEENFTTNVNFNSEWTNYGAANAVDVYAGTVQLVSGTGFNYDSSNQDIKLNVYSTGTFNRWTASPDIDLSNVTGDGVILTFDLRWNAYNTSNPGTTENQTTQIHVAASGDGGQTWQKLAMWDNAGLGDYPLSELNGGHTYSINVSQYINYGKIRVAFHGEQNESGGDNDIHVDNVILDRCEAEVFNGEICDNEDYVGNGFAVTSDTYKPGLNVYSQILPGQAADGGDKVILLNLDVHPTYTVEEYMTTCQGEQVVFGDYSFTASTSMDLPYIMTTATGCDSTIVLHLTVNKPVVVDTIIKACEEYTYNGVTYQLSTTISDTLQSVATGCDSIYNVLIQIAHDGGKAEVEKAVLCLGGVFDWHGHEYTQGGTYTFDTISAGGCDISYELQLFEADALGNVYDTITVDDLPYSFAGEEYLGANVNDGDYQFPIRTSCGQGTLYVHVGKKQDEPVEGLLNAKDRANAKKVVVDGLLYLTVGDRWYDAQGRAAIKPIEEK